MQPFSDTGAGIIFDAEEGVETAANGSEGSPAAGNGAGGHALAPIEPLEGGGAVLAELARAVEHDLSTPDHAPATERAYAHDWPTSRRSAAATASRRSRRPRRPSRSTSRPWRPSVAARRPVSRPGPSGSRCRRCAGDSPRLRAATRRPGSRRRRSTPSCAGSCAGTAVLEGRPCGRRSRS